MSTEDVGDLSSVSISKMVSPGIMTCFGLSGSGSLLKASALQCRAPGLN